MLKNVPPCLPPLLLQALAEMGHGDEVVIADANFPGHRLGARVIRLDGVGAREALDGVMQMLPLDTYAEEQVCFMQAVKGDEASAAAIRGDFVKIISRYETAKSSFLERFAFYERARQAYAIVLTGETAPYGNVILKKGVINVKPIGKGE